MLILTGNSFSRIQAPFSLSYVKGILWKDEITNIIAVKKICHPLYIRTGNQTRRNFQVLNSKKLKQNRGPMIAVLLSSLDKSFVFCVNSKLPTIKCIITKLKKKYTCPQPTSSPEISTEEQLPFSHFKVTQFLDKPVS
jgi:hypothetical protein